MVFDWSLCWSRGSIAFESLVAPVMKEVCFMAYKCIKDNEVKKIFYREASVYMWPREPWTFIFYIKYMEHNFVTECWLKRRNSPILNINWFSLEIQGFVHSIKTISSVRGHHFHTGKISMFIEVFHQRSLTS